jgi:hypothetical protein
VAKDPTGLSGGLLILWNPNCFNLITSFFGDGFLGITVEKEGALLNFINIYSPCNLAGKKNYGRIYWLLSNKAVGASGAWVGILMQFYDRRKEKGVVRIVDKEKDYFSLALLRRWR